MPDIEVRIPNIGDFRDVPVLEVLVKPGDSVRVEDPLIALESEKATMEIPSPSAGVVRSIAVRAGDKVSEGSAVLTLDASAALATVASLESTTAAPAAPNDAPRAVEPVAVAASSVVEVRVPDLGDFADVPVIDVLVAPGDRVEVETSLVTLESEKAAMDVPSSSAGIVREVFVKVGDRISKGTLVASLETAAPAGILSHTPAPPTTDAPFPDPGRQAEASRDAVPSPRRVAEAPSANGVVHASPSVRRFARELGVNLHTVSGTGPHARITRDDVQGFVKSALRRSAETPRSRGGMPFDLPPWPNVDFARYGEIETIPLSRIRKLSGPNLHRNWISIPHVTNNDEADITDLEAFRKTLNAENPKAKVTMLAFVIKAAVAALIEHPDVNSSLDGDSLVRKKYYNIGFAADTPQGLIVPVLKNADTKGILAIANETAALAAKARDGKLGGADMTGSTFTISSLGGIGGTSFTPIVNAPEVAILGVSRSAIRPVWNGTAFSPRLMLPLSLSYDHRVIDGALAARFNASLARVLSDLRRAML